MIHVLLFRAKHFFLHLWQSKGAHSLHSPFVFDLYNHVIVPSKRYRIKDIEKARKVLQRDTTLIDAIDIKKGESKKKTIADIAKSSLSTKKFSAFLNLLCKFLKVQNVLEAGTSLGINSLHLSRSESVKKVITIEGSSIIAHLAKKNFSENEGSNIEVIQGNIYEVFIPAIVQHSPDIIFLDADHRGEAIDFYIKNILLHTPEIKCIIVHDIYWSQDMLSKWNEIVKDDQFKLTVDIFQAGLIFPNLEMPKQHFKLKF